MSRIRRLMIAPALFVWVIALPCRGEEPAEWEKTCRDRIERLVRDGQVVGIAAGWITPRERLAFGTGRIERDREVVPNEHTVFEIGSVTKVFTTLILAQLIEQRELTLETPVNDLLPPEAQLPNHEGVPIRLVDLATHTSGLPRLPSNLAPDLVLWPNNPYAHYTTERLYAAVRSEERLAPPSKEYRYSNFGMGLLGHILSLRAAEDYQTLVEQRICRPLGLHDTAVTFRDGKERRTAKGHQAAGVPVPDWDILVLTGAGGLRSTVDDLLKFVDAQLHPESTPFPKALLLTHQRRGTVSETLGVGLGWHILVKDGIWWHNGQTGGYHAFVGFDPKAQVGLVLLANSASEAVDACGFEVVKLLAQGPTSKSTGASAVP